MPAANANPQTATSSLADREIISTRVIPLPREQVFAAFADPARLAQWWGPDGFTNTIQEFDLRPGGAWNLTMHAPNGANFDNKSIFRELVANERVVYDHIEPIHAFRMIMTYADEAGATRLTWQMQFESPEEYERIKNFVVPANEQNFDRLERHLGTKK